ncbi:MAG: ribulose-phosphate 3-epimerase [Syntrophomonadaceae bacterium]|nr:ribulose-phosphate 3-epimerase [Syntrophomonadaceae bacterium]
MVLIAPSILSANFARLAEDIQRVEQAGADWLHIDVMDGHFVPNLTIGPLVVRDIKKETGLLLDVHLMIEKPENLIPAFIAAGADLITVHAETCPHLHRTLTMVKEAGRQAGVSLNPSTPVAMVENVIGEVDLVLAMTVNPGFGGQKFIHSVLPKISALRAMIARSGSGAHLQVDGGINVETGKLAVDCGADVLVAGSFIFAAADVGQAIRDLKNIAACPLLQPFGLQ